VYGTRMRITKPVNKDELIGKTLYVWKATDCYHNLTIMNLRNSLKRAKLMDWQSEEEHDKSIEELMNL